MGWDELSPESATAFDVAVHAGTLVGATAYLRHDVVTYVKAVLGPVTGQRQLGRDGRIGLALAVSAVPAGVIGVVFSEALSGSAEVWLIGILLVVFGLLLGWSDRCREEREVDDFGFRAALLMGVAQALALQPGVSRSGITISAARLLGFRREPSVRLAFLMSLPVIAGAGLYGLFGLSVPASLWLALLCGAMTAMVVGWVSVWATVRLVRHLGLVPFVIYRVVIGLAVLGVLGLGWR